MRKFAIAAAAIAFSFGASAGASPFSLSVSAAGDSEKSNSAPRGLIEIIVDSTASAFGAVFSVSDKQTAGDKYDDAIVLRYYKNNEACPSSETAEADPEPEAEAEDDVKLVGPEPIYFGF